MKTPSPHEADTRNDLRPILVVVAALLLILAAVHAAGGALVDAATPLVIGAGLLMAARNLGR